jgi:hypothetical protein
MIDKSSILRQKGKYSAGLAQIKLPAIRPTKLGIRTKVFDYRLSSNPHKVTAP